MFVGLPGAGKSSYRKRIIERHKNQNICILSTDDYIENLAKEQGKTYSEVFKEGTKESHKIMNEMLIRATKNKDIIIWDQTNLAANTRRKKLRRIPDSYEKICVFFDTPIETIREVNEDRKSFGRNLPEGILNNMIAIYEPPCEEKETYFSSFISIKRVDSK